MTDREDSAMDDVKAAAGEPMLDCVTVDPRTEELRARDHAVLAPRQVRDDPINASAFTLTACNPLN
jgi:hypothetical protein